MNKQRYAILILFLAAVTALNGAFTDRLSVKLRLAYLETADESDAFTALGIDFPADAISVEDKWIPEFDIEYAFSDNLLLEVVLTIPQEHEVTLDGVGSLGDLTHIPPTFSLVYQFTNDSNWTPYISLGVNTTWIIDVDLEVADVDLDLDTWSIGLAGGIGIKYILDERWDLDASVKWIQLSSDVTAGGSKLTEATLDPLLYSFGVVYKF